MAKFFSEPYYEWYDSVDGKYEGLQDSLKYIEQLDKQHGPFHGVRHASCCCSSADIVAGLGLQSRRLLGGDSLCNDMQ